MTRKTTARQAPKPPAKASAPAAMQLSDAQLDQVRGGLNYTKICYSTN